MSAQLALNLRLRDSASFANFYAARNAEALDCLRRALASLATGKASEHAIFLSGASGSGRSHLLQAACHLAQDLGVSCIYAPLQEMVTLGPGVLEGLETSPLLCLDDLHLIAGQRAWEEAVFALVERSRVHGGLLLVAANAAPKNIGLTLPDLVTRLGWGPEFTLQPLNDEEKLAALQLRAQRLGLELPTDVASYVLARHPRDAHSLFAWLDRADRQSLIAQRRLTIPFVRQLD